VLPLVWLAGACAGAISGEPPARQAPAASSAPAEPSVRPGVNAQYFEHGALARWTGVFEGESREVAHERDRILDELPLRPGMAVGDIGAGTGLFSIGLAERVGASGRVYATDIVPEFLSQIARRARSAGARNVHTVLGQERATGLPDASLDLAFLCNVYHHLEYPMTYLASLARALRPQGLLVVIDFERIEGKTSPAMLEHVRAGKEVVIQEISSAGFTLVEDKRFLKQNYFLVFRAPHRGPRL
jgi:SAM-dependent methyltransferase